jgi:hypothetical protein
VEFNKFQTVLSEELIKSLPKEVYADIIEFIDSVKIIQTLVSSERKYSKDLEKDSEGKLIVSVTEPHILEDMDFFRQRAIHYNEHNCYTKLYPNSNPNSEYSLFWKEELKRWKEGLVRPSDGEWIPGYYYFYLNYCPIWKVEAIEKDGDGKRKGKRSREFPNVWLGDYLFFHYIDQCIQNGQHAKLLKARGMGFSFKLGGSMSPCNMYTIPGQPNFHLASDKTYLLGEKGVYGKTVDTLDWIAENTPFAKLRLIDKPLEKMLGFKNEYGGREGLLSSVYGISIKDDPDKARGIRGALIHYEEDGVMPGFKKAWNVNLQAVQDGDIVYGLMMAGGTGGTEGADFEGSEDAFYFPKSYNIRSVENVYDKGTNGDTQCGFFWGAYMNRAGCYDEDGEPDVIKALIEICRERYSIKRESSDPLLLTQKKAELPITPQEAIMRTEGTIFPVADLKDYLSEIMPRIEKFTSGHWIGRISINTLGEAEWKGDQDVTIIRDFPLKDNKRQGGIEIFVPPIRNSNKEVPYGRYIAGMDTFDDDHSTTTSLGSMFIMDTWTDIIVAEYTGRPSTAQEFHDTCYRLLKFYNAICNYENNWKGFFTYMSNKHALYHLCDTPQILKSMEIIKGNLYGNKAKGTPANASVNNFARRLQADWMLDTYNETIQEGDQEKIIEKMKLYSIRSVGYIKEAINWNIDGNFDRVSAMGMLMILREDRMLLTNKEEKQIDALAADKFWNRNFKRNPSKNSFNFNWDI